MFRKGWEKPEEQSSNFQLRGSEAEGLGDMAERHRTTGYLFSSTPLAIYVSLHFLLVLALLDQRQLLILASCGDLAHGVLSSVIPSSATMQKSKEKNSRTCTI